MVRWGEVDVEGELIVVWVVAEARFQAREGTDTARRGRWMVLGVNGGSVKGLLEASFAPHKMDDDEWMNQKMAGHEHQKGQLVRWIRTPWVLPAMYM
ncbi:hypothetical protein V6N11_021947 [Hibiscus sabdariffa]|uniref:Uncharacterized protein n=1 Tax=Hibiscus sabdariffa TaxID=183260 RepID=A0ABR2TIB8_9ROSI